MNIRGVCRLNKVTKVAVHVGSTFSFTLDSCVFFVCLVDLTSELLSAASA